MDVDKIIVPLGILTYAGLISTVLSGVLFMKFHVRWLSLKWHAALAILTVLLASLHAGIVIFLEH